MEHKKIEEYKVKLKKEEALILSEIDQNDKPPVFNVEGDRDDMEEEVDQTDAFSNQLAVVGDLKKRLADIQDALLKIESGKYGICENCGAAIGENVLDVDPESRLCRECKLSAS